MSSGKIFELSDLASAAQAKIQQEFRDIDPVVGIMRSLRESGFSADAMTIDSFCSGKRIILLLHDDKPNEVAYQFSYKDKDPDPEFIHIPFAQVTADQLYRWMKGYFSES